MKIYKYLRSLLNKFDSRDKEELIDASNCKEISNKSSAKMTSSKEITEPLLTISQAARKNGVTRQAIFFAIRMNRLNAHRENDTWLITEKDLKEYVDNKYDRSRSRKKGKLIFDKSKGFYSISEAAKFLGKNNNHIYYLVRMGRLKTHRQGNAIVIQDLDLYMHAQFYQKRKNNNLKTG